MIHGTEKPKAALSTKTAAIALGALCWLSFTYIHQHDDWNQNSRLCLLHALVEQRTLRIDRYQEHTGDKSSVGGHYYSDKPPGIALLALVPFAASIAALRALGVAPDGVTGWKVSSWAAAAGSVGLLSALGSSALFVLLCAWMERRIALLAALGTALGSLAFPYATMLMSHGATYGLLMLALVLCESPWALGQGPGSAPSWRAWLRHVVSTRQRWLALSIGTLCGLAIAGEYASALGAGAIGLLAARRGARLALHVALGAVPHVLLVFCYNYAAFGSPLVFGYSHVQGFAGMHQGVFGITLHPRLDVALALLFGSYRGLFFWSPFLMLALGGLPRLWSQHRFLFWVTVTFTSAQVLLISSYPYWNGGFALGPRHLMAMVPFVAVAAGLGLERFSRIGLVLGAFSILLIGAGTVIDALPPAYDQAPLTGYYLRALQDGTMAYNLGQALGLSGYASLLPLVLVLASGCGVLLHRLGPGRETRISLFGARR
jgi:hypothetical protein